MHIRDVSFRFVSFRLVYLPIHIRFVSFSSRIVSFRFDYTRTLENDWNNKTKRNETSELACGTNLGGNEDTGRQWLWQLSGWEFVVGQARDVTGVPWLKRQLS